MEYLRLGVNIDHVATIRNARGGGHPYPVRAARQAAAAGRAGRRRGEPARVIVQAWQPEARALRLGARHAVEEFLQTVEIDPGSRDLVLWCERHGVPIRILSDGFDWNLMRLQAIHGIRGIDHIFSSAAEGHAGVWAKLDVNTDTRRVLDEIKTRVETRGRNRPPPGLVFVPWFDASQLINKVTLEIYPEP